MHPGYGFLAENAGFAEACAKAGLVFVGPSADAIRRMGDKAAAKKAMEEAGVPCVPGWSGEEQDAATLAREAARIGFPVMIKAVAGGGGRGMRLVEKPDDFPASLRSAKSEAESAFGDGRVLLERAILRPRHIEIQVFGDRHGNAIHLGERDCSVQRRHQKLVEEAPSPFVDDELRKRMGAAAVAAVKAIGYEGAGTLEFLVDASGEFWFMEMNTRLQVEHPVTEEITGLDLVALQLRIAAGEPLGIAQQDVRFSGHAIEARLCAEDPAQDFVPQSGRVALWRAPKNLRVETALESGTSVSPHYDSMVAKLIAHGATRDEARRRLVAGLRETALLGLATNRAFLAGVLAHPTFSNGEATTDFVAAHGDELNASVPTSPETVALAAVLLRLTGGGATPALPHPLAPGFPVPLRFVLDGEHVSAELTHERGGGFAVTIGNETQRLHPETISADEMRFAVGDVATTARFARAGDRLFFQVDGRDHAVEDLTFAPPQAAHGGAGDGILRASTAGQVTALHAAAGDAVEAGQPLVTVEAMKMEHVHRAAIAGVARGTGGRAGRPGEHRAGAGADQG